MSIYPENIIFKDETIVAVNKPTGMLTIPDGYHPEYINLKNELDSIYERVWTVHRLDKETSGVIIFALTQSAHRDLNIQFTNHLIMKEYIAITHNNPDWKNFELETSIKVNGDRKHRTLISNTGKLSKSLFLLKNQDYLNNISEIKIQPKTGYTHQIRCHLSHLGFPIVGDKLYSRSISDHQKAINKNFGRLMLHSNLIIFNHPQSGELIEIKAPIPNLFKIN